MVRSSPQTEKAYYADANLVAFVRPGLVFKISRRTVATDGTVKVRYTITDPKGLPLDRDGRLHAGHGELAA